MNTEPLWQHGSREPYGVVSSFADITELKHALSERDKLIDYLDSFAHTVAHDLKNPTGLVLGYASLLTEDGVSISPEDMRSGLQTIEKAAESITQIIDALLLLASTSGMDSVPRVTLDMHTLAYEAQDRLRNLIEESGATLRIASQLPKARGYAPWVVEIFVNYLSNAVKYGGRPPRIEVGAAAAQNGLFRYWVRDNGRGLTPDEQKQLFQPFKRLPTQAAIDGHGLGLSIVRQIAERLGGAVAVSSRPGTGSEFSFFLPADSDASENGAPALDSAREPFYLVANGSKTSR